MGVNGIHRAGQVPELSRGGSDASAVDQKIRQLENQLRQLRSNRSLSEEEKAKRIENIQKQIEQLKRQREQRGGEEGRQTDRQNTPQRPQEFLFDVYA